MNHDFNFEIKPAGEISAIFLKRNITEFISAMNFIRQLPYGRNPNKKILSTLFTDNCGTCSTKHAVLKTLTDENNRPGVSLVLGMIRMNKNYSPAVGVVLQKNKLEYIPEAHNYLRIENEIVDCTRPQSSANSFIHELLTEIEIQAEQITDFKVDFHKDYLRQWLTANPNLTITLPELWKIREDCIAALSSREAQS